MVCWLSALLKLLMYIGLGIAGLAIGLIVILGCVELYKKLVGERVSIKTKKILDTVGDWSIKGFLTLCVLGFAVGLYYMVYEETCLDTPMTEKYYPDHADGRWILPTDEDLSGDVTFISDDGDTTYYTLK